MSEEEFDVTPAPMDERKRRVFNDIDQMRPHLIEMADYIFDNPEFDGAEFKASKLLTDELGAHGFAVERGLAGFDTAFRAVWEHGEGGPVLGILCEYDALVGLGHGCGHHMQGPGCLGAAFALKDLAEAEPGVAPFKLVVYGTPAEETQGAKCAILDTGYFRDIDVALMMHGSPTTCTDVRNLADKTFRVTYHGVRAHAAMAPERGRSAFDALLVAFNGVEFLREHVPDDVRMHYTVSELPGPENVVPAKAVGEFSLRAGSKTTLDAVVVRFEDIVRGAALIAGVTYDLEVSKYFFNKIPVLRLNELLMANAKLAGAPRIAPPRKKTGSSDFGNVMHEVPGSCIRVAFVPVGSVAHSQEYVDAGKTEAAHDCVVYGAKSIAGCAYDLVRDPSLLVGIRDEFDEMRKELA